MIFLLFVYTPMIFPTRSPCNPDVLSDWALYVLVPSVMKYILVHNRSYSQWSTYSLIKSHFEICIVFSFQIKVDNCIPRTSGIWGNSTTYKCSWPNHIPRTSGIWVNGTTSRFFKPNSIQWVTWSHILFTNGIRGKRGEGCYEVIIFLDQAAFEERLTT